MKRHNILISGGGIAGLTAALCLARHGHKVNIFERAQVMEPLGAGIQISPNAFHVLRELGLSQELLSAGDAPQAILMMNAVKGIKLADIPLGFNIQDKYDAPYLVIHRADLQNVLFAACNSNPDIEINFGSEITDAAVHPNGITAFVQSDSKAVEKVGDLLIGADGIHSHIRKNILHLKPAHYVGKTAWRTLIAAEQVQNQDALMNTMVWLGPKAHAVTYPVKKGSYLNVIAVTQEAENASSKKISQVELREKFSYWSDSFTNIFDIESNWSGWPLYETPSVDVITKSKVVLIGDAAHAMLPFAAQGAAQAIEDAYQLSQCLSKVDEIESAFKTFEQKRVPRIKRIMKTARSNGSIYHLSGFAASIRNIGLSKISGNRLLQKQDWIYRWKP